MHSNPGIPPLFVTFEGIDGCGKSTLMASLIEWMNEAGIPHLPTREPGGTDLGESIRGLLLSPAYKGMDHRAEVLLYTASRAQLVHEVILPALQQGFWVIADRYTDATLAYQGYGRGMDLEPLRRIQEWATGGLKPHRTILLDCSVDVACSRVQCRSGAPDRIEAEKQAFHQRVHDGYLELAKADPERFLVLNAERSVAEVIRDFRALFWESTLKTFGR